MWDPHQQHLKSTLEMVQRRSARRILHDLSPTSSASDLVAQLQLGNLQSGRTSGKVCRMYKTMTSLVDVNSAAGLLEPRNSSSRRVRIPTPSPPPQNRHAPAFLLSIGNPTLELCPHRCSVSRDSTCPQNCTEQLDGRTCLLTIRISDIFLTCFNLYH